MAFYESISPWYNYIFPLSEKKVKFVRGLSSESQPKVTETGCATGEFAMALAKSGCRVFGFDLDEEMITMCRKLPDYIEFQNRGTVEKCYEAAESLDKTAESSVQTTDSSHRTTEPIINFKSLDMLEIDKEPLALNSDIVCCFGNTLVHLNDLTQVESYIKAVYSILRINGTFTGQIVNYDRIIQNRAKGLPTIDNQFISFKRTYSCSNGTDYDESSDYPHEVLKINFETELLVKKTGQVIQNSIPLLALKKSTLESILKNSGFTEIAFYGNYDREEWTIDSGPTIFTASKLST
jgi:hypothetical protein